MGPPRYVSLIPRFHGDLTHADPSTSAAIILSRAPQTFASAFLNLPQASNTTQNTKLATAAAGNGRSPTPIVRSPRPPVVRTALRSSTVPPSSFSLSQNSTRLLTATKGSSARKPTLSTRPLAGSLSLTKLPTVASQKTPNRPPSHRTYTGKAPIPMSLGSLNITLFKDILNCVYTGSDGSQEVHDALLLDKLPVVSTPAERHERLRSDLFKLWRQREETDVVLKVGSWEGGEGRMATSNCESRPSSRPGSSGNTTLPEGIFSATNLSLPMDDAGEEESAGSFACHRAILVSRAPYFATLLLGSYSDSDTTTVSLSSPPFTPTALYFTLGFIYTGTLQFSSRSFDLTIAFQIWRAAAYLQIKTLATTVSSMILHDFCHTFTCSPPCKTCVKRVPRTLAFSCAPDVSNATLRTAALKAVTGPYFAAYWGREVGTMDQNLRDKILAQLRHRIAKQDGFAIEAITQTSRVSRMLESERANKWSESLRGMIDDVEAQIQQRLVSDLEAICESKAWNNLIDGVGLLADVLRRCLELLVAGIDEARAPDAYQVLVGKVLLKGEDGLPAGRERDEVEEARQKLLKFLGKRWVSAKSQGAFNGLEKWALKEIADELNLSPNELILDAISANKTVSKTGLKTTIPVPAARRLAAASPQVASMRRPLGAASRPAVRADDTEREAGPINLRAAVLNRNAAKTSVASGTRAATLNAVSRSAKVNGRSSVHARKVLQCSVPSKGPTKPENGKKNLLKSSSSPTNLRSATTSKRSDSVASSHTEQDNGTASVNSPERQAVKLCPENECDATRSSPDVHAETETTDVSQSSSSGLEVLPKVLRTISLQQGRLVLSSKITGAAAHFSGKGREGPSSDPLEKAPNKTATSGLRHPRSASAEPVVMSARTRTESVMSGSSSRSRLSSRASSRASCPTRGSKTSRESSMGSSAGMKLSKPLSKGSYLPHEHEDSGFDGGQRVAPSPLTPVTEPKSESLPPESLSFPRLRLSASSPTNSSHLQLKPSSPKKLPAASRAASVANLASLKSSVRRRHVSMLKPGSSPASTSFSRQTRNAHTAIKVAASSDALKQEVTVPSTAELQKVEVTSTAKLEKVKAKSSSDDVVGEEIPLTTSSEDQQASLPASEIDKIPSVEDLPNCHAIKGDAPLVEIATETTSHDQSPQLDESGWTSPERTSVYSKDPQTPTTLRRMPVTEDEAAEATPRPSKAPDSPRRDQQHTPRPSLSPTQSTSSFVPAASLSVGIPCLIWPSLPGLPPRTKFRGFVKYIGPLQGRAGPVVGVEIPRPLPAALQRANAPFNDGSYMGKQYFYLGNAGKSGATTPCSVQGSSAPHLGVSRLSEHLDMFARAEREARRRRIARLQASASAVSGCSTPVSSPPASIYAFPSSAPVSPGPTYPGRHQQILGQLSDVHESGAESFRDMDAGEAQTIGTSCPNIINQSFASHPDVGPHATASLSHNIRIFSEGGITSNGRSSVKMLSDHSSNGALRTSGPPTSASAAAATKWGGGGHLFPFLGHDCHRERRSSWSPSLVAASVRSMSRSSRPPSRSSRSSRTSSFATSGRLMSDEDEGDGEECEGECGEDEPGVGLFVSPDEVMWVFEDE